MPVSDQRLKPKTQDAYEAALAAALDDLTDAKVAAHGARESAMSAEARVAELTELARSLAAMMPQDRATPYLQRLHTLGTSIDTSKRAGPVYENVVELFSKTHRRDWSAADVQTALAEAGKGADPKAVYNVLSYLARRGRLRRYGRGRYLIVDLGVGIELDQDLEGVDQASGGCAEV